MKKLIIKNNKVILSLVLLLFIFVNNTNAKTTTAIVNGEWEGATTWDNGLPEEWDIVIIPNGITVTVSGVNGTTFENINIQVQGMMILDNGQKLRLDCNSLYELTSTGTLRGINGGSKLEVCSDEVFRGGSSDLRGPASFGSNPLPVELINFNVTVNNNVTKLTWSTASETNNASFMVEKSTNGINYSTIGEVKGVGNSTTMSSYSFSYKTNDNGVVYYRLKQVDFDGRYEYSHIISISNTIEINKNNITVYPNPLANNQNINISGINAENILYEIFDVTGKKIKSDNIVSQNGIFEIINSYDLTAGTYFIKINTESNNIFEKIIIQ